MRIPGLGLGKSMARMRKEESRSWMVIDDEKRIPKHRKLFFWASTGKTVVAADARHDTKAKGQRCRHTRLNGSASWSAHVAWSRYPLPIARRHMFWAARNGAKVLGTLIYLGLQKAKLQPHLLRGTPSCRKISHRYVSAP